MFNLCLIVILIFCVLHQAAFQNLENVENGSPSEPAVLPYSLKAVATKQDNNVVGGRYTLMAAVKPSSSSNQRDEQQITDESNDMVILQNRRTEEDPWERISVHYKNQLAQTKSPSHEFGYFNLNGVAAAHHLNVGNHFGIGAITAALPLVLMLIVNIGVLIYLVFGTIATLSAAAAGGLNISLPSAQVYFRGENHDPKYFRK